MDDVRTRIASWIQPTNEANSDSHTEHDHDHAGHDHGEESKDALEVSAGGLKSIGFRPLTVTLDDFEKSLTLPATVVERPGHSQIQIPAPLSGLVTRINVVEGAAIEPGSALFELRLTHEELVTARAISCRPPRTSTS
ncbi:MAG: biotin/lipoyl-binding protein [Pirellulales bacterium]